MIVVIVETRELHERYPARLGRSEVALGDKVLVSTANGLETAVVVELEKTIDKSKIEMKIIRHLNKEDYRILEENKKKAQEVLPRINKQISTDKLNMKLTRISFTYDRQKLFIYYTAAERVDFRNFIRVLGVKLKVRIQMVQIGVRDEAAILGGFGICGRDLCCHRFLRNIESINIDMARNQQISLNPENISGCCGRLLCCLRYENEVYEDAIKKFPVYGSRVNTAAGKGEVIGMNYIKGVVQVRLKSGAVNEFSINDLKLIGVKDKIKKWIK